MPGDVSFRSYIDNEYMGHKWQCVEFARRFLFLNHGFVFTDVGMAYEIFSLRFLRQVVNDNILPLQSFANGSLCPPVAGALLIWQKGGEFYQTGHVAVITQLVGNINQDPYQYFTITECAEQEPVKATNELHLMYLHATDKVMKDDDLLALFDIPKILWPRLRLSWQRRRHDMITGRTDFCMDERGLKVYEYNADSASCHTEGGLILEQWARQGYPGKGHNPAEELLGELTGAWKHSLARPFVHIMQDKDLEENYHAGFMQRALTLAGWLTASGKPGPGRPLLNRCARSARPNSRRCRSVPAIRIMRYG